MEEGFDDSFVSTSQACFESLLHNYFYVGCEFSTKQPAIDQLVQLKVRTIGMLFQRH